MDVEIALLLTGKAGARQVFGGGGGAHRHRQPTLRDQIAIRVCDRLLQIGRQRTLCKARTNLLRGDSKSGRFIPPRLRRQIDDLRL
ncbi:MAG: hypothetical protein IPM07_09225 [Anaerolineales bacterium]|nr:hypothetical protein [Anaerolineales bacterium]